MTSSHLPELLTDLLREVGRHLDIAETAPRLLEAMSRRLPVRGLLIRRYVADEAALVTAAGAGVPATPGERTPLPGALAAELASSLGSGGIAWIDRDQTRLSRAVAPAGLAGPLAALPLGATDLVGVAVLAGDLAAGEREALQPLAEPLTQALANDERLRELSRIREADEMVGADSGLREVMRRVDQVAPTDVPVLITGETGSGKEVVARAVHGRSRRARGPFLRVNCGAIPPELVDSELFGHERGSFTGAVAARQGWFERADGGTLFLDEIGELPPAAQVRLLRVLQDGAFERVGGQEVRIVDVRIVAATHRDLSEMVEGGGFRRDLWYRISVFPVRLPPLRERKADLPELARHFARAAGVRLFGRPLAPSAEDLELLAAWDWPGNVRELMSLIERAAILGRGARIDVTRAFCAHPGPQRQVQPVEDERAEIEAALARCLGRIEGPFGAAAVLGVNPHTLRSRMRRLGIDWARYRSSNRSRRRSGRHDRDPGS